MKYSKDTIRIGTCSWNYSSWKGLVYSELKNTAAEYLVEYSKKYNTVEIDSWFYKIPDIHEVDSYVQAVDSDFKFSIKAPQKITQIMEYGKKERNKSFLSIDLYEQFYKRVEQIKNNVSAIMFEFEYMNKEKMSGQNEFIDKLTIFIDSIPRGINIGIECRNKNYLNKPFYQFLKENDLNLDFPNAL